MSNQLNRFLSTFLLCLLASGLNLIPVDAASTFSDDDWISMGGIRGDQYSIVYALAVDRSGNVYAGGDFSTAGESAATNIAKWNGSSWSALGSGLSGPVSALAVDGSDNVYAGGAFFPNVGNMSNYIAKWDGNRWSVLGSGLIGYVSALAVDRSGNVYAGGGFSGGVFSGQIGNYGVAKWDGNSWSPLGVGIGYGGVDALAVDGSGNVYAGGALLIGTSSGIAANGIAKWNGSSWSNLGYGVSGHVSALAIDQSGNVYAGGNFMGAGRSPANNIAKWDGSSWSALGLGTYWSVYALGLDRSGNVFVGGYFMTAGGVSSNNIVNNFAKWDGNRWSALGSGVAGTDSGSAVRALAVNECGNVFVGGNFSTAGGKVSPSIAEAATGTIALNPAALPKRAVGVSYTGAITASGGVAPYTLVVTNGSLPTGLSLSNDGVLSGTPAEIGTFNFTIATTDAHHGIGLQSYSMKIGNCSDITLSPATASAGNLGIGYFQILSASDGVAPYSFAVTSGSLPSGLDLTTDGLLIGMPLALGTNTFTVTATDASGCTGSADYTLAITPSGSMLDTNRPMVAITSPRNRTLTKTAVMNVSGVATDASGKTKTGVAVVLCSANGGARQSAATFNKFINWTAQVTLQPGWNTVTAQAFDYRGNASSTWTNSYYLGLPAYITGAYNGLVSDTNGVATNSAGMLENFVLTPDRRGSGYLLLAGRAIVVRGQFDLNGAATILFTNLAHAYTLVMQLDAANKQITGTLSDHTSGWRSVLIADRAGLSSLVATKTYTLQLSPADSTGSAAPGGWGYAVAKTAAGKMFISGFLGDGVPFSQIVPVSKDGNIPFYVPLYPISRVKAGMITGLLHVDADTGAITGAPAWIKPDTRARQYPAGFTSIINAFGNSYDPRVPISLDGGSLEIGDPAGGSLHFTVKVSSNRILKTGGDTNALTGAVRSANGIVILKYRPTGAGAKVMTVTGVADQPHNSAKGTVLRGTNSAAFDLH